MQHGVNLADGRIAPIHLLAEVLGRGGMVAVLAQVVRRMDQHAATAAGGVVNGITWARLQNAHQGIHHLSWREELPCLRTASSANCLIRYS
nr:hypothetical protein [Nitrosospira multiformis]